MSEAPEHILALVIGAGPAGLAAAEMMAGAGTVPVILEAKPSVARKFLMAGKSGLNLTKNEPEEDFRAAINAPWLEAALADFGPAAAMAWAEDLGEPLFTGSSGRVFPKAMKASPLLRKWLARLASMGVTLRTGWRWTGLQDGLFHFETPEGPRRVRADAVVLALGGASWPRLGSDGGWATILADTVPLAPFRPANMGFDCEWSDVFRERFAGAPVKPVRLRFQDHELQGEFVISRNGVEGSAIYQLSAPLRDALEHGPASLLLDLVPGRSEEAVAKRLSKPQGRNSRSNHLRKTIGLEGVRAGLLRELAPDAPSEPEALASLIKALPLPLLRPRPLAEAISSAGGIRFEGLDDDLMIRALPGVFAAGEMLDWEAPTGGYLITASMATGRRAGAAAARWLKG